MSIEQLVRDLVGDAVVDVERATCWLQKAEDEAWLAVINRIGWQSGQSWINDELDATVAHEQACLLRAEQHLQRLLVALGLVGQPNGR